MCARVCRHARACFEERLEDLKRFQAPGRSAPVCILFCQTLWERERESQRESVRMGGRRVQSVGACPILEQLMLHPQQTDELSVILLRRSSRAVPKEFCAERTVQNISDYALLSGGTRRTVCASSSQQDTKRFTSLGTRHRRAGTTTRFTRMHGLSGTP